MTVQSPVSAQGTAADSPGREHMPAAGRCAGVGGCCDACCVPVSLNTSSPPWAQLPAAQTSHPHLTEHTQGCAVPLHPAARRPGRLPLAGSPCWWLFPVDNNDKEAFCEGERRGEPSLVIGQKDNHKAVPSSECPARNCWVTS